MFSHLSSQADYLLYTGVTLAAFAVLGQMLRRSQRAARLPRWTWPTVATILIAGWWPVQHAGEGEAQQIARLVSGVAPTYARELARMDHAQVTLETPTDSPLYQKILQAEADWLKDNPNVHDIYTMRRLPDGRRVFLVDSDTDYNRDGTIAEREQGATRGEVYDAEDPGLDLAFNGLGHFDFKPVTDKWGTWVGAWAPIFDAEGKVDAVVGVDFDARSWFAAISRARWERIAQLALLLATIGAAAGAIGVLRGELHIRHRTEEELRQANERWQLIVDHMPLAFVELTPAGQVLGWNPAAEAIFGFSEAEVKNQNGMNLLLPSRMQADIHALLQQVVAGSGGDHSINENVTRDGRAITCEWFNAPVKDAQGEVVAVVCLARDLTERLNLEAQVRQAQKMQSIGLLAAGVAHDFNNILTIIQGHTDLLQRQGGMPSAAREDLAQIARTVERAAVLVQQLVTFSRRQVMFAQPLNLNERVQQAVLISDHLQPENIHRELKLTPALPLIEADPAMIEQLVHNLTINACEAMPGGGRLTISTRQVEIGPERAAFNPEARPGPAICLTITDTGHGIPAENLPHIFEPFFTTKAVGKGPGLGLAAAYGIVKQHRGWIEVRTQPGKGTQFDVFIPPAKVDTVPSLAEHEISSYSEVSGRSLRSGVRAARRRTRDGVAA